MIGSTELLTVSRVARMSSKQTCKRKAKGVALSCIILFLVGHYISELGSSRRIAYESIIDVKREATPGGKHTALVNTKDSQCCAGVFYEGWPQSLALGFFHDDSLNLV